MIGFTFFLLTVLCVPELLGAATTPRWALMAVALPLLISGHGSNREENKSCRNLTSAHAFGLLFIWYAAISVSWSHHYDGLDALIKLIVIAEAFWLGSKLDDLKPIVIGMGLGIWVNSLVILSGMDVPSAPGGVNVGLFANSNVMGEIAGLVLVTVIVYRVWWLIPGIIPAFLMSHCRGAFVAVACVFIHMAWRKSKLLVLGCVALGIAGLILGGSPQGHATISSTDLRMRMWTDILPNLSLMGTGLGSTFSVYPLFTTLDTLAMRPDHLHNDWLEYALELGVVGSIDIFAILVYCRSTILAALFIEACFGFPLHMAATAVLAGLVAGHSTRNRHSLRHDLDAWRVSLLEGASSLRHKFSNRGVSGSKERLPA